MVIVGGVCGGLLLEIGKGMQRLRKLLAVITHRAGAVRGDFGLAVSAGSHRITSNLADKVAEIR
jgi:hypothetical protein